MSDVCLYNLFVGTFWLFCQDNFLVTILSGIYNQELGGSGMGFTISEEIIHRKKTDKCFGSSIIVNENAEWCKPCGIKTHCKDDYLSKCDEARSLREDRRKKEPEGYKVFHTRKNSTNDKLHGSSGGEVDKDRVNVAEDIIIFSGGEEWVYSFPVFDNRWSDYSAERLHKVLEKIVDYHAPLEIRDVNCSINIELNNRFIENLNGVKSPRFRPRRKSPHPLSGKGYSEADSFYSNDAQVIAMHWHYIRGRRHVDSEDKLAKKIYGSDDFDFLSASKFSVIRGGGEKKVELLGLTLNERWESGSFDDNEMRKQWKSFESYNNKAKVRLKQLARRNNQMRNYVDEWGDLLMPMLIEEACTKEDGKFSPKNVARLYQLATGNTMSRQFAYSKIKSITNYLPDWRKVLGKS